MRIILNIFVKIRTKNIFITCNECLDTVNIFFRIALAVKIILYTVYSKKFTGIEPEKQIPNSCIDLFLAKSFNFLLDPDTAMRSRAPIINLRDWK